MGQKTVSVGKKISDMKTLLEISIAMTAEKDLRSLLNLIMNEVTRVLDAERSTLYLYDSEKKELFSFIAQGEKVGEIRLPFGKGLAGSVAQTKEILNIEDAYSDPRFNKEIDYQTGWRTRNMLIVPLLNLNDEIKGVIQVMNKCHGPFVDYDIELLRALASQAAVAIEKQSLYEENEKFFRSIMKVMAAAIDARDPVTAGHSERVAKYSVNLAAVFGFPDEIVKLVEYAALLHDVGKIGISDLILCKPGKLNEEEYAKMKTHPTHTLHILSKGYYPNYLRNIPVIASCHHERLDGSGYPKGLKSDEFPQLARIIAVTDIYDALVAQDRPYKHAFTEAEAFAILREEAAKNHLDSEIVDTFIEKRCYNLTSNTTHN
ncbi:MAG: HD-GYP domain-containing protein [Planctomycetota bacterium]